MKFARVIIASATAIAAFAPIAAYADEISSTTTTVQESTPSTTVIEERQPVLVAPASQNTTIVDKRKRKHLISLPFVKLF